MVLFLVFDVLYQIGFSMNGEGKRPITILPTFKAREQIFLLDKITTR